MQHNHSGYSSNTFSLGESFEALMSLNIRTAQKLFLSSQEEFLNVRGPEDLLEKTIEIMVETSQTNLNYIRDLFQIFQAPAMDIAKNNIKEATESLEKSILLKPQAMKKQTAVKKVVSKMKSAQKTINKTLDLSTKKKPGFHKTDTTKSHTSSHNKTH